jgi:uncharacterized repeat protein (TIGR01451 family)
VTRVIPFPLRTLALGAALVITHVAGALAQTAPDTIVTNTISLQYNSGSGTPTVTQADAATVVFHVDRKVDLGMTAQAAGGVVPAVPGQAGVVIPFLVENRGNDTQGFVIAVADGGTIDGAPGLTYSAAVTTDPGSYYVLISPDGTTANGVVYSVTAAGSAGDLNAGESFHVLIVANVPIAAIDGQFDDFTVTATATDAGAADPVVEDRTQGLLGVNTVFADAASNSTRQSTQVDGALNGKDADETRLEIRAPIIVASKTAVVLDEGLPGSTFNCATGGGATGAPLAAMPGACVQYTITVENTSTSGTAAGSIQITDPIPANTTRRGESAGGFDSATYSAGTNTVTASLSTLAAGASASFTIRVTVD